MAAPGILACNTSVGAYWLTLLVIALTRALRRPQSAVLVVAGVGVLSRSTTKRTNQGEDCVAGACHWWSDLVSFGVYLTKPHPLEPRETGWSRY
jgi:hypothetical protein